MDKVSRSVAVSQKAPLNKRESEYGKATPSEFYQANKTGTRQSNLSNVQSSKVTQRGASQLNIARKDDPVVASVDVAHILDTEEANRQSQHII